MEEISGIDKVCIHVYTKNLDMYIENLGIHMYTYYMI